MKKFLLKYFIPGEHNQHHPHILREASFAFFSFLILALFSCAMLQKLTLKRTDLISTIFPKILVELANKDRVQYDLPGLKVNPLLVEAAEAKAQDMAAKGYFAHTSPEGLEPWHWFNVAGYNYRYAGENLAINFSESDDVNFAWMNSPTHRANILNEKFTEVGIASVEGFYNGKPTTFVVQEFGKPSVEAVVEPQVAQERDIVAIAKEITSENTSQPKTIVSPQNTLTPTPALASASDTKNTDLALKDATTSTTTLVVFTKEEVKGASTDEEVAEVAEVAPSRAVDAEKVSAFERVSTNPARSLAIAYSLIGGLIALVLVLFFNYDRSKQHHKMYVYGVALLLLMFACLLFYNVFLGSQGAIPEGLASAVL